MVDEFIVRLPNLKQVRRKWRTNYTRGQIQQKSHITRIKSEINKVSAWDSMDQDQEMNEPVLQSTDPDHQSEDLLKTSRSYSKNHQRHRRIS
ncbi:hypothetical protein OSB04_un001054 [Centaurea solstitialis]|uniref:Uncharacterized protein n=1 Tax=Centaurea solstitialis TaxID=347529 RepID=A0AA38SMG3_9ASTR|nr:hypothetical protein OSB04_un001054 [Centaurea solstitialis]